MNITTSDSKVPPNSAKGPLLSAIGIFRSSDIDLLVNEFLLFELFEHWLAFLFCIFDSQIYPRLAEELSLEFSDSVVPTRFFQKMILLPPSDASDAGYSSSSRQ